MSIASTVGRASDLLSRLEAREALRLGIAREKARPIVARALGCSPGTVFNIVKKRVKGIKDGLTDRIEDALIRSIRRQMEALEHEATAILDGSPRRNRVRVLAQIEEDLARLKAAFLNGEDE